jgi:hypothetical protein
MTGKRTFLVVFALALVGLAGMASSAGATFHLIKVREVSPGTVAQPESDYVELQAYSVFQNQVQFGQLRVYNANGTTASTFTPAGPVANNEDQRTLLIADSAFDTVFPGVTPDSTDSALNLSPAAGAVCWPVNSTPIDCVSWGAFTGNASLPSSAGTPLAGSGTSGAIGDGKAIKRSIAPGCPTFLEDTDDTNNSAGDFSEATPNPRPNSAAVVETSCGPGPGGAPPSPAPASKKKRKCKKKHKHHHHAAATKTAAGSSAKKKCKKHRK